MRKDERLSKQRVNKKELTFGIINPTILIGRGNIFKGHLGDYS